MHEASPKVWSYGKKCAPNGDVVCRAECHLKGIVVPQKMDMYLSIHKKKNVHIRCGYKNILSNIDIIYIRIFFHLSANTLQSFPKINRSDPKLQGFISLFGVLSTRCFNDVWCTWCIHIIYIYILLYYIILYYIISYHIISYKIIIIIIIYIYIYIFPLNFTQKTSHNG